MVESALCVFETLRLRAPIPSRSEGRLRRGTHAGLSGALAFSYDDVLRAKEKNPRLVCLQRINDNDARKGTNAMDRLLAEANRAADHTVFVSDWLRDYHASRWFDLMRSHSVILNGADPSIFHPIGAATWKLGHRFASSPTIGRIISAKDSSSTPESMRSLPPGAFRIRRFGSLAGGPSESAGGAQRRSVRVSVAPWRTYCAAVTST